MLTLEILHTGPVAVLAHTTNATKLKPERVCYPPPAITFGDSFGTFQKHDGHKRVKKDKQPRVYPIASQRAFKPLFCPLVVGYVDKTCFSHVLRHASYHGEQL